MKIAGQPDTLLVSSAPIVPDTEEATGSIPVPPTQVRALRWTCPWAVPTDRLRKLRSSSMASKNTPQTGVLYEVACGAPAASSVADFLQLARRAGWRVRVIATPMGMRFIDADQLAKLTGDRVRVDFRMPGEADELPPADAVVVAPATFNTVNKWAAGITDTFATGLLCELTGLGVPIVAVPQVKDALARHVAFGRSLDALRGMGVRVLFDAHAPPQSRMPDWAMVLDELHAVTRGRSGRN
jgi:Flavoprotein